jgi:hypothetical protein
MTKLTELCQALSELPPEALTKVYKAFLLDRDLLGKALAVECHRRARPSPYAARP